MTLSVASSSSWSVIWPAAGLPKKAQDAFCAPWGSRHFARSVRWLMGRSGEELKSMGERGQSWVREHRTYKRIADDLEQQYTELLFSSPDRRNRGMIVDG